MLDDKSAKDIAKIEEQFGQIDDTALAILKGHLLIESKFDEIIGALVAHGEFLESLNLRFLQKLVLVRSFSQSEQQSRVWDLLIALNELRNALAHSLHSERRQTKEQKAKQLYFEIFPEDERETPVGVFVGFAAYCMGFLEECRKEAELGNTLLSRVAVAKKRIVGSDASVQE